MSYFKVVFLIFLIFFSLITFGNDFFECEDFSINTNLWNTSSLCYNLPFARNNLYILNKKTNTEVNRELLFAFYEDFAFKELSNQSASYKHPRHNMIKLADSDLGESKIGQFFNNELDALSQFLQWHEIGHIWYDNHLSSDNKMIKESFSDVIGVLFMDYEKQDEFLEKIIRYRKKSTKENKNFNYYTIDVLKSIDYKAMRGRSTKEKLQEAAREIEKIKEKDLFEEVKEKIIFKNKNCVKNECFLSFFYFSLIFDSVENFDMSQKDFKDKVDRLPEITYKTLYRKNGSNTQKDYINLLDALGLL